MAERNTATYLFSEEVNGSMGRLLLLSGYVDSPDLESPESEKAYVVRAFGDMTQIVASDGEHALTKQKRYALFSAIPPLNEGIVEEAKCMNIELHEVKKL